jgi:Protein of unknown function (DUF2798)
MSKALDGQGGTRASWHWFFHKDNAMDGPARFIFPILMSGVMAFMMTALVTWLNLGFPADFLARWVRAFMVAWPCAAVAAFIAIPLARRGTGLIIRLIQA